MKDFLKILGRIPTNLNLDEILEGVKGNKTRIQHLKDGIVYFVSLLTIDNYNYVKLKDGYIPLTEKILSNIVGYGKPSLIVKVLKENNVIEVLPHRKGHSSRKYRLTEKYNSGEFQYVVFSDRIRTKLQEHRIKEGLLNDGLGQVLLDETGQKYQFLFDQFSKNNLEVDLEQGKLFIKNLGTELLQRTMNSKKYKGLTLKSLFNYIGRMINLMEDIHRKDYNLLISPTNYRFHSNLTSINKTLRPFLNINGQEIGEVDISSSQPYILSTILNREFTSSEDEGYNLHTIYPELFESLVNSKNLVPSKQVGNNEYVLGVYLNDDDYNDLIRFTRFDFSEDFYTYILNEGKRLNPELINNGKFVILGRDYIKDNIMKFLFQRNELNRERNDVIKLLTLVFPGLCSFVDRFNQDYTNSDFSILLQRTESFLMLEKVVRKISKENPDIPFFTIHDSIVTTRPYLEFVKNTLIETISSITGKPLKVKSKIYEPSSNVPEKVLNKIWGKVNISTKQKYDKLKPSILGININKGMELLIDEDEREKWLKIMV